MSDAFRIIPYIVRSAGTDVPPEEVQAAINSLANQVTLALNSVASDPTGPAGGDLSGTYPNPTVAAVHATSGTLDGVVIGGTTPAAGHFTTISATTPLPVTSGGTGVNALTAHALLVGEGSSNVAFAAPGAAGTLLASNGVSADPTFQTQSALGLATTGANTFTGTQMISGSPSPQFTVNDTSGTGSPRYVFESNGTNEWALVADDSLATFALFRYVGGTLTDRPISVANSTGLVTFADGISSNSASNALTGGAINNATVGATTPSSGKFTTITASSTITPSSTAGIVGTTTNDNANAGSVGEFITNTTNATSATSTVVLNATSVSLTAGDWDVSGSVQFVPAGTTTTTLILAGVTTTSATRGAFNTETSFNVSYAAGQGSTLTAPTVRISLASTTTVYLVALTNFSVSTMTVNGFIQARRRR